MKSLQFGSTILFFERERNWWWLLTINIIPFVGSDHDYKSLIKVVAVVSQVKTKLFSKTYSFFS